MSSKPSDFIVGLIQMDIRVGDCDHNVTRAAEWIAEAASCGAQMAVLPELWSSGYALDRAAELASAQGEGASGEMERLAAEHRVWLAGSILEHDNRKVYNTMIVCDPAGRRVASYRKTHLFGLMDEPQYLTAGEVPVVAELPFGRTGLAVCYDLRFPRLFAAYIDAGCEAFVVCAEWPNPRLDHWRTLLRARAIENQAFVIACNRVGGAGTTFFGHSMVLDPWGDVLAEGEDSEGVVIGRIDLARLGEVRKRFPFLADDRKFDRRKTVIPTAEDKQKNRNEAAGMFPGSDAIRTGR
jgi:omega-amidase